MTDSKDVRNIFFMSSWRIPPWRESSKRASAAVSTLSDISEERVIPAYRSIHRNPFGFFVKTTMNAAQIKGR